MKSMPSLRQIAAARANGCLSNGPKTPAGKFISSRNALQHGFGAQFAFLPGEDAARYRAHHEAYRRHYASILNEANRSSIAEIADLNWRLLRAPAFEARVLARDIESLASSPEPNAYATRTELVNAALARLPQSNGMKLLRRYTRRINFRIHKLHTQLQGSSQLPEHRPNPRNHERLAA